MATADRPFLLPDADVWLRAFNRAAPDPTVVSRLRIAIEGRRVLVLGAVRLRVLAQTRDERQFVRMETVLDAFADLAAGHADHTGAARLMQERRQDGIVLSPHHALLWTIANRVQATVWSSERRWGELAALGAPVRD